MKIATKIAAGYGVLFAVVLGALAYQVSLIHQMQSINRNLSGINFRAATLSLQMLRDLDQAEEFTSKYFATGGDPGYGAQREEMREAFSQALQEMESLPLDGEEEAATERLAGLWGDFLRSSGPEREIGSLNGRQTDELYQDQLERLGGIREQTQILIREARLAIETQVNESAAAGQHAERISWIASGTAVLLSLIVSFLIVRSISEPLGQLTEGTRAVTEGKYFYQLDASGRDELAQLAGDFNTMARRLGELDQMKKDFVSHVSHEFKTPLASLQETARLLLDEIPGPLTPKQKHLLALSLQSGDRLSAMIGNLLDLSRMEAGVMEYDIRNQDLAAVVRAALAEFETQLREKSVRLEARVPEEAVPVPCDKDRIFQVVTNLLSNALKFSPGGGTIQVSLLRLEDLPKTVPGHWRQKVAGVPGGEGFVLVTVSDSGPGVPAPDRQRIFEKFHQGSRRIKAAGQGTGLGLAIGRTIVEAHRGALWVEDNPGGGSRFCLLLGAGVVAADGAYRVSAPM